MLVTIKTKDARIGMFVHAVEGGWLASPFWRAQLVLTKASEINKLLAAGINEIVIDTTKGVGPALPVVEVAEVPAPAAMIEPAADSLPATELQRPRRRAMTELDRARGTVERCKSAVMAMFGEVRLGHAVDTSAMTPLVEEIAQSVTRDASAMLNVTRLKTKDEYTYLHSVAVAALLVHFARHLKLPEEEVLDLCMAGLLHDIGKMAVPNALLAKPGKLDPPEMAVLRHHPEKGHALLRAGRDVSEVVLDVCLHHHERVDGRGYPFGLTGEQLSMAARMGAICDVYDAVTSLRPYKRPWSPSDALSRMQSWTGHFDQELLARFIDSIGIHPVGGLVRLRSSRLALVIEGNDADPTAPRVRVFYDIPMRRFIPQDDLWAKGGADGDPIHRSERGSHWFDDDWPAVEAAVRAGQVPSSARPSSTLSLCARG
ncbi:MAG: hypothetical protein DI544_12855 [Sphingomonas taxi]|uniref:HD-GYP domain-containing protein n=1 Tax=Sphingomonas taxi TaxID=1549858 RepID=A0A2W5P127_9SPHN|nr:MAG: hypothetical protein DI544_12855 [Sphingomonas taxi]